MISINFEKVSDVVSSDDFKQELFESFKTSTLRHASELHDIPKTSDKIDDLEYNIRSDFVILRLMNKIAERISDGMDEAKDEEKLSFVLEKSEYLFGLLTQIVSADELFEYMKGKI